MSNDVRTQSAGRKIAGLGTTMLIVAGLFGPLLLGLVASAPRASGGLSAPQPMGDPTSGWIPDVPVASDPVQAERNPSIITAANGDLYMAYETGISGSRDIYFTTSSDGGNSWTLPVAIAASGVNEVTPSIAQDPFSGRIFVAYAAGISGATPIHAAYSDDGITWTDRVVLPCGVLCVRPRIVSEYWNGTNNMVYVALSGQISANDWNMAVARSSDHGASWTWYESGLGPTDVRYQPDIAVQKGMDGVDRVFVFYRGGATFPGTTGYVEWSTTHGSSFAARASWYSNVYTPPAVAASHDGSSLLLAYSTNTPQVTWVQVPNPTDLTTFTGTWAFLPTAGVLPAVTVDGAGTVSTAIGGSYYLIAYDTGTGIFNVTAPVTLTSNADWSSPETVSDTAAIPSSTAYDLTITAQLRTGTWYPA
ncbi:MAG TPA: sialidase family protein, partial [Thermoplasmata archaeon]|nr:sialidase family protein [Thermoplasmata archaeon]